MAMRWINLCAALLAATGPTACAATGPGDVAAVVQDEEARQAAARAAQHGESAKDALKAGEAAVAEDGPPTDPPIT
jgi:hypothetical protein